MNKILNDYYFPESVMRAFIGADHLRNRLSSSAGQTSFPPHNIEQISENSYTLTMALAGYSPDDVDIHVKEGTLIIESVDSNDDASEDIKTGLTAGKVYLHRGISFRRFSRQFVLGEHIEVTSAKMENGLLSITLDRIVPEAAKPKRIPINTTPQIAEAKVTTGTLKDFAVPVAGTKAA